MDHADVVVVGGGIAGLAAAHALAADQRVTLVEREPMLAAHASGKNAAMYRPLELDSSTAELSRRTLDKLRALLGTNPLRQTGMLLVTSEASTAASLARHAASEQVSCQQLGASELTARAPALAGSALEHGLWLPGGGVLDIHAITSALARGARACGADLRLSCGVSHVVVDRDRVQAVRLQDGSELACQAVVLAAGAWGAELGASCGAPLPLQPSRRHLVQLELDNPLPASHPILWRLEDQVYVRPESGGLLASPCDEQPWAAEDPPADPRVGEWLAPRLAAMAPALQASRARSHWACLRTFAPDQELVVGPDPRIKGLFWLAGLGGRGMSVAVGAGGLLCEALAGTDSPLLTTLAPSRLLQP